MATGVIKKPISDDFEWLGEQKFLNTSIRVYRCGRIVTMQWWGAMNAASSAGEKNWFIQIPVKYAPPYSIADIFYDQNGKRFIMNAQANGNVGIYYQLDAVTEPTNIYGIRTWVTR